MNSQRRHMLVAVVAFLLAAPLTLTAQPNAGPEAPDETSDAAAPVKKITLREFEEKRGKKDKDVVVLDVRTPKEFAGGHVPGAVHINWRAQDFSERVAKLDRSKKYLVYCLAGVRSAAAAERMRILGFTHLYDFAGGWDEYGKSGKPVQK